MINFGITGSESIERLGINAKMNEFQTAMGLCLMDNLNEVIAKRKELSELYDTLLKGKVEKQMWKKGASNNYGYYPIIFPNESSLKRLQQALKRENIYPRRYFYPSLDELNFLGGPPHPVSKDISRRILSLPLYHDRRAMYIYCKNDNLNNRFLI